MNKMLQELRDNKASVVLLILCLLASVVAFVPFQINVPGSGLDPSWRYGMNQAVSQGMSLGKEIVFTFGPYASIYTREYHPDTDFLMLLGSLYLALSFSYAAFLNFRNSHWFLKVMFIIIIISMGPGNDALFFFYPLLVGVQTYRWLNVYQGNRLFNFKNSIMFGILFAPLGLLPIIKGSFLFACLAAFVLSLALFFKKKKWFFSILITLVPIVCMTVFWLFSGQKIIDIFYFFKTLNPIVGGYSDAMSIKGNVIEWIFYIVATVFFLVILFFNLKSDRYDRICLVLIFLSILFLAFKAGFVRHDGHAMISALLIMLSGLLGASLISKWRSLIIVIVVAVPWSYIYTDYGRMTLSSFEKNVKVNLFGFAKGISDRVAGGNIPLKMFNARLNEINMAGGLPKLNGSVDIYSYDQSFLLASGNKWSPRPTFQSYSVYTADLAYSNAKHLLSVNRPDYIFFNMQPIDGRYPSIEDGASWPALLSKYYPVSKVGNHILLSSEQENKIKHDNLKLIKVESYSFDDVIQVPKSEHAIFVKIKIDKNTTGKILNALFKPGELFIEIEMNNGEVRRYRIISDMLNSGFLLSPLVENAEDFGLLYANHDFLNSKNIKSIQIFSSDRPFSWKSRFEIEFYNLMLPRNLNVLDTLKFQKPYPLKKTSKEINAGNCVGGIDGILGMSNEMSLTPVSGFLQSNGWLAISTEGIRNPDKTYISLTNLKGEQYLLDVDRVMREDIGTYFRDEKLKGSGYSVKANVTSLHGEYKMELAYSQGGDIFLCPNISRKVIIE